MRDASERRRIFDMTATQKLIELAMLKRGLTSYHQLAIALKTSAQRVAKWRHEDAECDDDAAVALAELAGIKPGYAVLTVAAGRTKTLSARTALMKAAERLAA